MYYVSKSPTKTEMESVCMRVCECVGGENPVQLHMEMGEQGW